MRDDKIDSLKGILILLVVYGHIPFGYFNIEKGVFLGGVTSVIYFFHMPLFFVISSLFVKQEISYLKNRFYFILIPYIVWYFYIHKRDILISGDFLQHIGNIFLGNWYGLESIIWFLPALFSLNFLIFLYYKYNYQVKTTLIFFSVVTFLFAKELSEQHNFIPFGLDVAVYLLPLVVFAKYIYNNKNTLRLNNYILVMSFVIGTSLLLLFEPVKTHSNYHAIIDFAQFSVPYTVVGYISFIIVNLSIFFFFINNRSSKIFEYIGKYSYPIFLLHLIILYRFEIKQENMYVNISFLLLAFILSIISPIILSKILMKISNRFKYIGMVK